MTKRLKSKGWLLPAIVVLGPFLLCLIYYSVFAIGRYESSARVVVRQAGAEGGGGVTGIAALLSGSNRVSHEETLYLSEFIRSPDMLSILEKELKWSEHFMAQKQDPLFWLWKDASAEDRLKFYNRLVDVYFDPATGLLQIRVQALEPKFAESALKLILQHGELLINELSHRMGREQVLFAQSELRLARSNFEDNTSRLLKFQKENNLFDASASASSQAQIVASLESSIAVERASLKELVATLNERAPQVQQKRARISALGLQLSAEKARLVSQEGSSADADRLNIVAAEYRNLTVDAGISEEIYKLAVSAVESARIEASKKIRSLMVIVSPNLPDEPIYPRTWYNLATIFFFLLLAYGITRFIIATIEDHRD